MNRFLILFIFLPALAFSIPEYQGFVTDHAGVISQQDRQIIEAVALEVKNKSTAEIAVLTVATIEPYSSIDEFALETAEKWGIGDKDKDNGVLIVLSTGERYLKIEVGYGLEGAIPDSLAGSIMDRFMLPYLRENNFSEGLKNGALAVASVTAREYNFVIEGSEYRDASGASGTAAANRQPETGIPGFEIMLLLFFLFGGGRFFWPLLLLSGMRGRRTYRGGFGSGFGRTGGFSGGFGGFGGGSFGGGGASRSF